MKARKTKKGGEERGQGPRRGGSGPSSSTSRVLLYGGHRPDDVRLLSERAREHGGSVFFYGSGRRSRVRFGW